MSLLDLGFTFLPLSNSPLFLTFLSQRSNLSHLKKAGAQGLKAVIIDQNMSRLETEGVLKKVLPALFDVIVPLPQYPAQLTKELV